MTAVFAAAKVFSKLAKRLPRFRAVAKPGCGENKLRNEGVRGEIWEKGTRQRCFGRASVPRM
jgi:hypothetical protein